MLMYLGGFVGVGWGFVMSVLLSLDRLDLLNSQTEEQARFGIGLAIALGFTYIALGISMKEGQLTQDRLEERLDALEDELRGALEEELRRDRVERRARPPWYRGP